MKGLIILLLFLCYPQATPWKIAANGGPAPRYVNKLIDTTQGLLLFGGKNSENDGFNDLWKWHGNQWTYLGTGATKRWDHSYVFLQQSKQLFVFGGRAFSSIGGKQERIDLNDNWVYQNGAWKELKITSPPQRSSHAMSSLAGGVLLFGGRDKNSIFADTWIFDGTGWKKIPVQGPEKRFGHSMSFDPTTETVYLFGGHNGERLLNDIWSFKAGVWTLIKTTNGPSARMAHSMQFDDQGNGLLFGGWSGTASDEVWILTKGKWSQIEAENGPEGRLSHAMGYDSNQMQYVLFGGSTGFGEGFLPETWQFKSGQR